MSGYVADESQVSMIGDRDAQCSWEPHLAAAGHTGYQDSATSDSAQRGGSRGDREALKVLRTLRHPFTRSCSKCAGPLTQPQDVQDQRLHPPPAGLSCLPWAGG